MTDYMKRLALITVIFVLAGCASPAMRPPQEITTFDFPEPAPSNPEDGAVFDGSSSMALFEDVRGKRVGDIITVILAEETAAEKEASTSTAKDTDVGISNPTLLGSPLSFNGPGVLPNSERQYSLEASLQSQKEFSGEGSSSQSNSLSGRISVTVVKVLPNGNLVVRGEKGLRINQGDEFIRVSGIIRPVDIRSDNTILSTEIANANIAYSGSGFVADSNSMGWLARFFNSKWWPF